MTSGISNVVQGECYSTWDTAQCSHGYGIDEQCSMCEAAGPVQYGTDVFVSPHGMMTDRWIQACRDMDN